MSLPSIRFHIPYQENQISHTKSTCSSYREHLQTVVHMRLRESSEASILLPDDADEWQKIVNISARFKHDSLKYIVVIGIGGSNLGTKAIYEALKTSSTVHMLFVDTISPISMTQIIDILKICEEHEVLINVISKSGSTTETAANFDVLYHALSPFMPNLVERIVYTTESGSALADFAKADGSAILTLSPIVGGRYSVFSSVGIFPLLLAGINVDALRNGAREMRNSCLNGTVDIALDAAVMAYLANQHGKTVYDSFIFHPMLEDFGKWFRQLLGESIGKEETRKGEKGRFGMIPTVSMGTQDLHSVAQCYFAGPDVLYTAFVSVKEDKWPAVSTHQSGFISGNSIAGKSLSSILSAIIEGTQETYAKRSMPFVHIRLEELSAYSIGALLQFSMLQVMYFAHLLDVNAFDQPHVELYKKEVKQLLTPYEES